LILACRLKVMQKHYGAQYPWKNGRTNTFTQASISYKS
jgi:hypothetical protein